MYTKISFRSVAVALAWAAVAAGFRAGGLGVTAYRASVKGLGAWTALPELGGLPGLLLQAGGLYGLVLLGVALVWGGWPLRSARTRAIRLRWTPLPLLAALLAVDLGAELLPSPPVLLRHALPRVSSVEPPPPNLLLVTIDTLRADALGAHGDPGASTPTLDRLARMGLQQSRCWSPIPVTTSAHASLLTGAEPEIHGSLFNAVPLRSGMETLAQALGQAGYSTAASVGAFPLLAHVSGLDRGFDSYAQYLCPGRAHPLLWATPPGRWILRLTGAWSAERPAGVGNALALGLLPAEPFFLWVHYYEPHLPYDPPPPLDCLGPMAPVREPTVELAASIDRGVLRPTPEEVDAISWQYRGEVATADRALGRLLRRLAQRGLLDRTVVAVAADHGESLGEHDYFFNHGRHIHSPSLHVPALAAGPGIRPRLAPEECGLQELGPALLGLLEGPSALDGGSPIRTAPGAAWSSLLPGLVSRSVRAWPAESGEGVFLGPHDPDPSRVREKLYGMTREGWRVVRLGPGTYRAYDLEADPGETAPLLPDGDEQVTELIRLVEDRAGRATEAHPLVVDPGTRSALESLGYIGGGDGS